MAKLTIDDLKKIKERVHADMALREGDRRVKVTVHMGTCGIASGAREVLDTLLQEIEENLQHASQTCAPLESTTDASGPQPVVS